jgi:hypothetical protein
MFDIYRAFSSLPYHRFRYCLSRLSLLLGMVLYCGGSIIRFFIEEDDATIPEMSPDLGQSPTNLVHAVSKKCDKNSSVTSVPSCGLKNSFTVTFEVPKERLDRIETSGRYIQRHSCGLLPTPKRNVAKHYPSHGHCSALGDDPLSAVSWPQTHLVFATISNGL